VGNSVDVCAMRKGGKKNDACFLENSKRGQEESGERVEVRSVRKRGVSVKEVGQVDK
jgi:hypothetical protein